MHRARVRRYIDVIFISMVAIAPTLSGQAPKKRTAEQIHESFKAHAAEFDYLLGDWEFMGTNQEYGKVQGYWSAVRLDKGQILDEYRVVGDNAETFYATTTIRAYNAVADRWELVGDRIAVPAGTVRVKYRFETVLASGATNDGHLDAAIPCGFE